MLMPLFWGPNFKNHCSGSKVLNPERTAPSPEILDQVNKNMSGGGGTWTWSAFIALRVIPICRQFESPWPGQWPMPIGSTARVERYKQTWGHSATFWLCLRFIIYKIVVTELLRLLNRIISKRTQGSTHHTMNNNVITFVVDLQETRLPLFFQL